MKIPKTDSTGFLQVIAGINIIWGLFLFERTTNGEPLRVAFFTLVSVGMLLYSRLLSIEKKIKKLEVVT